MSWQQLAQENPELAAFGMERLHGAVAYLATFRSDGTPRVHPVTPILAQGRLFVFMEPTSPKGHDLRRNRRFAMHSAVWDSDGSNGEFAVSGSARLVEEPEARAAAAASATYAPHERYILFELDVDRAASTVYAEEGPPVRRVWKREMP